MPKSNKMTVFDNVIYSTVGIYVEYGIGMLASVIIARTLGPDIFGLYGYILWFVQLGVVLSSGAINQGVIKFVAESRGKGSNDDLIVVIRYLRKILLWLLLFVVPLVLAVLLLVKAQKFPDVPMLWLAVPVVAVPIRAYYMFCISVAKGYEKFRLTAFVALVVSPAYLLLTASAAFFSPSLLTFLLVFLAVSFLFFFVSSIKTRSLMSSDRQLKINRVTRQRANRHVAIVSSTVVLGFLSSTQIEVFFLGLLASFDAVANFSVALRVASAVALLVPGIFSAVILPILSKSLGEGKESTNRRLLATKRFTALLAIPACVFCGLASPQIIVGLFGPQYANAVIPFAFLLLFSAYNTWAIASNSLLVSIDKQSSILSVTVLSMIIKLSLGVWLVGRYGLVGAVGSFCLVSLISSSLVIWLSRKANGYALEFGVYFRILFASAISCLPVSWLFIAGDPNLLLLVPGAIVFLSSFTIVLLYFRFLPANDAQFLLEVRNRFVPFRISPLDRLLQRAVQE